MKRILLLLFAIGLTTASMTATAGMSTSKVRKETRFLTDKMAYELSLSTQQYNDAYEINYDFIYSVRNIMDEVVRGYEWALDDYYEALDIRNDDLRWVLSDAQYRRFLGAEYFYRPIYVNGGKWSFRVYINYPNRNVFYFGLPYHYRTYSGAHYRPYFHHTSYYRGRYTNFHHYSTPHRVRDQRVFHSYRRSDFGSVRFRPNSSNRPHNAPSRPGVTNRPNHNSRPEHNSRPGNTSRPNNPSRPSTGNRPNSSVRPDKRHDLILLHDLEQLPDQSRSRNIDRQLLAVPLLPHVEIDLIRKRLRIVVRLRTPVLQAPIADQVVEAAQLLDQVVKVDALKVVRNVVVRERIGAATEVLLPLQTVVALATVAPAAATFPAEKQKDVLLPKAREVTAAAILPVHQNVAIHRREATVEDNLFLYILILELVSVSR